MYEGVLAEIGSLPALRKPTMAKIVAFALALAVEVSALPARAEHETLKKYRAHKISLLAAQDDPQYTTPSDASCKSISPAANDYWCQTNCLTGCPKDMCQCGGATADAATPQASPSPAQSKTGTFHRRRASSSPFASVFSGEDRG